MDVDRSVVITQRWIDDAQQQLDLATARKDATLIRAATITLREAKEAARLARQEVSAA